MLDNSSKEFALQIELSFSNASNFKLVGLLFLLIKYILYCDFLFVFSPILNSPFDPGAIFSFIRLSVVEYKSTNWIFSLLLFTLNS